jgi:hypothetical protein
MTPCPDRRQGIIIVPLIAIRMVGRIAMTFEEIERGAKANPRRVSISFFGPATDGAAQARMRQWR